MLRICHGFLGAKLSTESRATSSRLGMHFHRETEIVNRRYILQSATAAALTVFLTGISQAKADVYDGKDLPQGAQQFAKAVKLKTDLKDVKKRLLTATEGDIDKTEWDNIGRFLRNVYSTAENDMKVVAKSVFNQDGQKRAINDVEQIKKYAQAGDISISKQDASGLASILSKISEIIEDFFDSLSDVPDEI